MFNTGMGQFELLVNGVPMKVGSDLLQECSIIENSHTTKPTVELKFVDNKQASGGFGLFQDGVPVNVTVGDSRSQPLQFSFRQWGLNDVGVKSGGDLITLTGVADLVPWFTSKITKAYPGHASDVVRQIAGEFGVPLIDVDQTQDKMTWLPDGRTVASFVRNLVDHAWMGQGSSPLKVMTSQNGQWMLRVKDIMKKGDGGGPSFASAGIAGTSDVTVYDYKIQTRGGALNSWVNYGSQSVATKLGGDPETFFKISFNQLSGFLGISSQLSSAVNVARTFFRPMAVGNTHDHYHEAKHTNVKSRATFSTIVEFLIAEQSQVKILDDISLYLANSAGQPDPAFSGQYKVSAITRHISRGSYVEKITAVSQGLNSDATS